MGIEMQFDWNSKDSICFGLYKSVIEQRAAKFLIWLESENREINLNDIRTGENEFRFNNFIIRENKTDNKIVFCPNIAGCPAYFKISANESFQFNVIRKDGTYGEEATFQPGEIKVKLNPVGIRMYKVEIEVDNSTNMTSMSTSPQIEEARHEENIPEFFGGFFSSSNNQPTIPSVPEQTEKENNLFNDTNIFTGGFSSESFSQTAPKVNEFSQQSHDNNQQPTGNDSNNGLSFFENMFPTARSSQESSNQRSSIDRVSSESNTPQPSNQNFGFDSSGNSFRQGEAINGNAPASGNVSGFSVPYVETEGIRDRREKTQDLQLDNDITAREVERLERQIAELENKSRQLYESKNSLISHLEVLQREYDKDYSKFQADIEEIKSRYTVDQSIIEYYKDRDLVTIESLLEQTNGLINRIEEQIRLFVTAQQKKSDDIEKTLKVGKKE